MVGMLLAVYGLQYSLVLHCICSLATGFAVQWCDAGIWRAVPGPNLDALTLMCCMWSVLVRCTGATLSERMQCCYSCCCPQTSLSILADSPLLDAGAKSAVAKLHAAELAAEPALPEADRADVPAVQS